VRNYTEPTYVILGKLPKNLFLYFVYQMLQHTFRITGLNFMQINCRRLNCFALLRVNEIQMAAQ